MNGHNKDAYVKEIKEINKVIKKAMDYDMKVRFSRVGNFKQMKVLAIADGSSLIT
jgi:hypothetical protein